jgi:hypothetical protein
MRDCTCFFRGGRIARVLWIVLVFLPVMAVAGSPAGPRSSPAPDGVCYPVNGTGYIVTHVGGLKIPVGTLSPLVEGDSLVVLQGTVTFLDFRTRQSPVYGAGTRLTIPFVKRPDPPAWWKRLEEIVVQSLSGPELERIGGSVRDGGARTFWPDSARFAPQVPVVFEWSGVRPAPTTLRICVGTDTTKLEVTAGPSGRGVQLWKLPAPAPEGTITWTLVDSDGESLGGGQFVILAEAAAEAERQRFLQAAGRLEGKGPVGLSAAVLAEADRAYLW